VAEIAGPAGVRKAIDCVAGHVGAGSPRDWLQEERSWSTARSLPIGRLTRQR
jgi:hypothetical protein